jgi:hypothetical protein
MAGSPAVQQEETIQMSSLPAFSPRRFTAVAGGGVESVPAALRSPEKAAPLSGFRIVERPPWGRLSGRPTPLRTIGGHCDILPVAVGFDEAAAVSSQADALLPSDADALPIDGTWRWLGLLCCWMSSALVASLLILAFH